MSSRAIEPFAIMLLWVGGWELLYTSNPVINLFYVIIGYIGIVWLPECFIWDMLFSCGTWTMVEPLHIHPVIALLAALAFMAWQYRHDNLEHFKRLRFLFRR